MLNYLTELTQEINASTGSRVFLEGVDSELRNNVNPDVVDEDSKERLLELLDIINSFKMADVKKETALPSSSWIE